MKNYYRILGIQKDATKEEISKAYRQLALQYHPDKINGPQVLNKFEEINEAKNVLLNENTRIEYENNFYNNHAAYDKSLKGSITEYRTSNGKLKKLFLVFGTIMLIGVAAFFIFINAMNSKNDTANFTIYSNTNNTSNTPLNNKSVNKKDVEEMAKIHEDILAEENMLPNKLLKDKPNLNKLLKNNAVTVSTINDKNIIVENSAIQQKNSTEIIANNFLQKIFSEEEMEFILVKLNTIKKNSGNKINCIQIRKTKTSNIENAFELATYFSNNGYIITGRQIVAKEINGILIDTNENCIVITVGIM